jgi:hypothetical protein
MTTDAEDASPATTEPERGEDPGASPLSRSGDRAAPLHADPAVAREPSTTPASPKPRGLVLAALATWLRYLVPLTLLSALALAPQLLVALRLPAPTDPARAQIALRTGWGLVATAWLGRLLLVGPAAFLASTKPGQLRALLGGLGALIRAILPCALAAAAIALGSLALVVPGLALLVLLSLTAASPPSRLPAPLLDSISTVKPRFLTVALVVLFGLALDAALGFAAYRALVPPFARPPTAAQLATLRSFVRVTALMLIVLAPLPATLLATLRARSP